MIRIKRLHLETLNGGDLVVLDHDVESLAELDKVAATGMKVHMEGGPRVEPGEQYIMPIVSATVHQNGKQVTPPEDRPEKPGRGYIWVERHADGSSGYWRKRPKNKAKALVNSRRRKKWWASMTPEERAALSQKMIEAKKAKRLKRMALQESEARE